MRVADTSHRAHAAWTSVISVGHGMAGARARSERSQPKSHSFGLTGLVKSTRQQVWSSPPAACRKKSSRDSRER
eukprot:6039770-Prymnesium_polylepis.1